MTDGQVAFKPPDDLLGDKGSPMKYHLSSGPPLPSGTETAELRTAKEMILHQIYPNRLPPIGESPAVLSHICPDKPSDTIRNPLSKVSHFDLSPDSSESSSDVNIAISTSNSVNSQSSHQVSHTSHHSTAGEYVSEDRSYSEYSAHGEDTHRSYTNTEHAEASQSHAPTGRTSIYNSQANSQYNTESEPSSYEYHTTTDYDYCSTTSRKRPIRRISNTTVTEYTTLSETETETVSVKSSTLKSTKSRSVNLSATTGRPKSTCCYIF